MLLAVSGSVGDRGTVRAAKHVMAGPLLFIFMMLAMPRQPIVVALPCPASATDVTANGVPHCVCDKSTTCIGCTRPHILNEDDKTTFSFVRDCQSCTCEPPKPTFPSVPTSFASRCASQTPLRVWTHDSLRFRGGNGPEQESRPLCSIPCACRQSDGTWLLPAWLEQHKELLARCGLSLSQARFVIQADKPTASRLDEGVDLVSTEVSREHFPHFFTDVLFPMVYLSLVEAHERGDRRVSVRCFDAEGQLTGSKCTRIGLGDINPGLLVRAGHRHSSWDTGVLDLFFAGRFFGLSSQQQHAPQLIPVWLQNGHSTDYQGCFRSVVMGRVAWASHASSVDAGHPGVPFFGINSMLFPGPKYSKGPRCLSKSSSPECDVVRVLVVGRATGRSFIGMEQVIDALRKSSAKLVVKNTTFETATFEEQVEWMQWADVTLSGHGAANTNWAFMRHGGLAIEVFPFGYLPGMFEDLAKMFGVEYDSVIAKPDDATFLDCVRQRNGPAHIESEWKKASAQFISSNGRLPSSGMFNETAQVKIESYSFWGPLRPCLRSQRLHMPAQELAMRITAHANLLLAAGPYAAVDKRSSHK